ncbi:MAG: HAD-IC family P-type ATPase, partial [bacterium]
MKFSSFTTQEPVKVLESLEVTAQKGLTKSEAEKRLVSGFNEIKIKEIGFFDIFLRQLKSPFFYLLFIASAIAFLIGEVSDSLVIMAFVVINTFLGFFQEARAHRAAAMLKKYFVIEARVVRDGKEKLIDKKLLVDGDIVLLEAGDIVPADLRILKLNNLLVDESALSGESFPVSKVCSALAKEAKEVFAATNIVFAGTSLSSGEMQGVVVATGKETVFGEIVKLAVSGQRESAYEKNLIGLSKLILKIVLATIIFIFLLNFIIKGVNGLGDFMIFAIALVVSIIPEALPLVAISALSSGAIKLAKKKMIVKRLSAVEDLGDVEILCTDKTGTLTENKLSLEEFFSFDPQKLLLYGLLASCYAKEEVESAVNAFDAAIYKETPKEIQRRVKKYKIISESPFEAARLRNSVVVEEEKGKTLIVRGAPETVLGLCTDFASGWEKDKIEREVKEKAAEGKRILLLAFKHLVDKDLDSKEESNLTLLGYFSFFDPLKETAKKAIKVAKKLGVGIKIVTGDSKEVAGYVAKEVGLIDDLAKTISGESLNALAEEDFDKACQEFSVFARIAPQLKHRIVGSLQKKYDVGFLGEGINDAPALKIANLAIVVPSAAGVSREVSDIILLEKDLSVIIDGIKEGRSIFSNINKYIKCTLASNFGNFYSIAFVALFIPFLPMLPSQI